MRKISNSRNFSVFIFAFLSAVAICMTFEYPDLPDKYAAGFLSELFWNLRYSLKNTSIQSTLIFGCLSFAGLEIEKRKKVRMKALPIVSFLLAIVWVMGKSFYIDDTLNSLFSTGGQAVKSIIYVIGISWLLNQGFYLLYLFLHNLVEKDDKTEVAKNTKSSKIGGFCSGHFFLTSMLSLLICWLPHLVISYPGYTCFDAWTQLLQYFGLKDFTSHHPPIHTLIMGSIIEFGTTLVNNEFGIFLFVILQCLCGAAVIAYALKTMKELLRAPKWLLIISFVISAVVPYYSGFVIAIVKDNFFVYAFLLFMIEFVHFMVLGSDFFKSKRHLILFSISVVSSILFRNNGKYVLYPFLIILVGYFIIQLIRQQGINRKKEIKGILVKTLALFLVPIICATAVNSFCMTAFDIDKGSRREALSFMFQQTARYVSEYEEEITQDEEAAISAILDYENLDDLYDPRISDPVKRTFNDDATTEDLINYLKVWAVQFFKHPSVYVEATLNQNYYLLYPMIENDTLYSQSYWEQYMDRINQIQGFEDAVFENPSNIQNADMGMLSLMFSIPLIGALSSPAVYNLILIALFIFSAYRKKINWIIASIPLILSDAIIVLAPVIQGHPRYAFPIIYSMPLLFAYYLYVNKKEDEGAKPAKSTKKKK